MTENNQTFFNCDSGHFPPEKQRRPVFFWPHDRTKLTLSIFLVSSSSKGLVFFCASIQKFAKWNFSNCSMKMVLFTIIFNLGLMKMEFFIFEVFYLFLVKMESMVGNWGDWTCFTKQKNVSLYLKRWCILFFSFQNWWCKKF